MSAAAADAVVCPVCGEANRGTSPRCWVCEAALPAQPKPARSVWRTLFIFLAAIVGFIVLIPVLLIVTCFGLVYFNQ